MPIHKQSKQPAASGLREEAISAGVLATIQLALGQPAPRHHFPLTPIEADVAAAVIRDELMLDGNARLNLATFVTTWMEPQAEELMAECFDKNMIDKDEYPQTAELEHRCVNMLADLWHAPGEGGRRAARRRAPARPACSAAWR